MRARVAPPGRPRSLDSPPVANSNGPVFYGQTIRIISGVGKPANSRFVTRPDRDRSSRVAGIPSRTPRLQTDKRRLVAIPPRRAGLGRGKTESSKTESRK